MREHEEARIEIKNRWTGKIIYSSSRGTIKEAVADALKSGVNLRGSNLRGADLHDSNLSYSDLCGSDLSGSNLRGSNLHGSDLSYSDLRDTNLSGANLRGSDLYHVKCYGRGGTTMIKGEQIPALLEALGIIVDD